MALYYLLLVVELLLAIGTVHSRHHKSESRPDTIISPLTTNLLLSIELQHFLYKIRDDKHGKELVVEDKFCGSEMK